MLWQAGTLESWLDSDEPFFSLKLRYQGDKLVGAALNGKSL